MDFALIKEHPYATTGIVLVGGVILYIAMRGGNSGGGGSADASAGYYNAGTDPATAAANAQASAQASQSQTYLSALSLQGGTQVSLAKIGADVSTFNTSATQDVTNKQTDAQLQLGLGTIGATMQQNQLNAWIQGKYIDAIVAAFKGNTGNVSGTPNPSNPTNPTIISYPTVPVSIDTPGGTGGGTSVTIGTTNPGSLPPGGGANYWPSLSDYGLDPAGGGFHCSPLDAGCVSSQNNASNNYDAAVASAQTTNNRNQLLANYKISVDAGVITPSQLAEYHRLQGLSA